jgi:succinoglycan biosynthesis transport protein ExoP
VSSPTMSGLFQALRRRWLLALGAAALAAAATVGAVLTLMPAKYAAQVRILVASRGDHRIFEANDEPDFVVFKANMAAMVKSPAVLQAALNQKTSTGRSVSDLPAVRDNGVEWLEGALKTDFLLGPEILRVVLYSELPDEGAELLNAVARAFLEENYQKDLERRDKRVKDYKDNLNKLENDLNKLRDQLRRREIAEKLPDEKIRSAQFQAALQQQAKAAEAVTQNRTEQIKAREELASVRERLKNLNQLAVTPEKIDEKFSNDERSKGIFLELFKLERDIIDTKANGRPLFVEEQVRNLERKKAEISKRLGELKAQLQPEFERYWRSKYGSDMQDQMVKLQDALGALVKQEPELKAELKKSEDAANQLAPNRQVPLDIINLQSKIVNLEASVSDISRMIQKVTAEVANPRVSLLQAAAEPKTKDYSRQAKLAGAGGLGMFLLALLGVAYLEFQSRKISGADEVAHGLGLNVVGALPPVPARARQPGAKTEAEADPPWQNRLHEAIDGIRTMLLHTSRSENLRVLMVTSALGGEGKTSLATHLAASLARAWRKTLLIDGDLRKPAVNKIFDVPQEPGFSELLRNEVAVADAVKPTALGRLWVMPAGHFDSHAVQALAQDNLRTLFEQLKQQYDFIIVDSCPVLPVADSLLLGQHVDGVIFSILRDVSRVPAVYAAQQKINNLAIRTLGAVMIGAKTEIGNVGYAYSGS